MWRRKVAGTKSRRFWNEPVSCFLFRSTPHSDNTDLERVFWSYGSVEVVVSILSRFITITILFDGSCIYFRFSEQPERLRFISMCSLGQATSEHKSWLHSNKCKTVHFAKISKSISFSFLFGLQHLILYFWLLPKHAPMSE